MLRKNDPLNGYDPEYGRFDYDFFLFHPDFYSFLG